MQLIIKRRLNDYDAWKKIVEDRDQIRASMGSRGITVYRSAGDPNEVILVVEWDDDRSYREYFDLPEVQAALAETGTTEVIEVAESFRLSS